MADPTPQHPWLELAKWPVAIFSTLLALIAARYALGIHFGDVTEIGPGGVKFEKAAGQEIADLTSKLNGALAAIEQLQKAGPKDKDLSPRVTPGAAVAATEASQTVSDRVAQLANVAAPAKASASVRGYIWLGDYDNSQWQRVKIGWASSSQPVDKAPGTLQSGTEYVLLSNMVVRDGQPANDSAYFNGKRSLGIAPTGSRVRLVSPPVMVDREFAKQYWAEVDVL